MSSTIRTATLLAAMTALLLGVGYLLGGPTGTAIALVIAVGINAVSYWNSDKMVLRMHGAREVDARSAPELHAMVRDLAHNADMPVPRIFIIQTDQPNAFATGRNPANAAVAVTAGLMRLLPKEELAGVIAHEVAHIKARDTLIMTITATIAGALSMLGNFALFFGGNRDSPLGIVGVLVLAIVAPLSASLVQMAISRTREYAADRMGAAICGRPDWLASALSHIQAGAQRIDNHSAERNPATAHLFIINPLHAHKSDSLFATHPAVENRIAQLKQLSQDWGHTSGVGGHPRSTPRRPDDNAAPQQAARRAHRQTRRHAPTGGQARVDTRSRR